MVGGDRGVDLGIAADELLVVSALDRSDHCAARALLLFAMFASGRYGRCSRCRSVGTSSFDHVTASFGSLVACGCGGAMSPAPTRRARMYLTCGPWPWSESMAPPDDELHVPAVRTWLGLESSVVLDGDLDLGPPSTEHELAERLAAADVVFLPHDGTAIPGSLAVARRYGIPTVATGFGARGDATNQWLTDYRTEITSIGSVRAHMDSASAMDALEAAASARA